MIRLVCGSGRCGSSLVMQMLYAGGVQVVGTNDLVYFEAPESVWHQFSTDWLLKQTGVVKLLHPIPTAFNFPPDKYRSIWLTRDFKEQAKSLVKLSIKDYGEPVEGREALLNRYERDVVDENRWNVEALSRMGEVNVYPFESILSDPRMSAKWFLSHFELDGDVDKMVSVVQARPSIALPDMTLEDKLLEQDKISSQVGR